MEAPLPEKNSGRWVKNCRNHIPKEDYVGVVRAGWLPREELLPKQERWKKYDTYPRDRGGSTGRSLLLRTRSPILSGLTVEHLHNEQFPPDETERSRGATPRSQSRTCLEKISALTRNPNHEGQPGVTEADGYVYGYLRAFSNLHL